MKALWNHGSNWEWTQEDGQEEVERLVLVELSRIIDSDFLSKGENKCKFGELTLRGPFYKWAATSLLRSMEMLLGPVLHLKPVLNMVKQKAVIKQC